VAANRLTGYWKEIGRAVRCVVVVLFSLFEVAKFRWWWQWSDDGRDVLRSTG
jgi:hypothetical protein